MGRLSSFFRVLIASFLSGIAINAIAQMPTQAQINQFQRLPPQQQKALAQRFGVDISQFTGLSTSSSSRPSQELTLNPRQEKYLEPEPFLYSGLERFPSADEDDDGTLRPFGYNLFSGEPTSSAPLNDIPVPSDYVIASGDELVIQLYGKESATHRLFVGRDGSISFPQLGNISVAGSTFSQLRKALPEQIKAQIIGVDVAISMGELRTIQVMVVGDAYKPGAYLINGLSTISQAIMAAGGFKKTASLRNIQVKRNGQLIHQLDLYDLLLKGDGSQDVRLQSGDAVLIGSVGNQVSVFGEVVRPAIYEVKQGETLEQIIAFAGGAKPQALLDQVIVERVSDNGIGVLEKDLSKYTQRTFSLKGGDNVRLLSRNPNYSQAVSIRGAVLRQGLFPVADGMRISDVFRSFERDIGRRADLSYSLLIRENSKTAQIEIFQFSLSNVLNNVNAKDNYHLKAKDQLWIFSNGQVGDIWSGKVSDTQKHLQKESLNFDDNQSLKDLDALMAKQGKVSEKQVLDSESGVVVSVANKGQKPFSTLDKLDLQGEVKEDPFSRKVMLKPLLTQLKRQASPVNPIRVVEIRGEVKYPGVFPMTQDARLIDLVTAAGGYREGSYHREAELSRFEMVNNKLTMKHSRIVLPSSMPAINDTQANLLLRSKDKIHIFAHSEWREEINVELLGEVTFPGVYTLQRGGTLQDVIERAGGFTRFAYPEGAIFSRESLRLQEQQRIAFLRGQLKQEIASLALRRQSSTAQYATPPLEAMQVLGKLNDNQAVGRMVIDLQTQLDENTSSAKLLLEDGDKLVIPAYRPEVQVIGQVQYSSNHLFKEGLSWKDYVRLAGGFKKQADKKRMYIIKASGAVMVPKRHNWFRHKKVAIEPGDTIVVPINTDYMDGLSTVATATQMLYQVGLSAAAIANLSRD